MPFPAYMLTFGFCSGQCNSQNVSFLSFPDGAWYHGQVMVSFLSKGTDSSVQRGAELHVYLQAPEQQQERLVRALRTLP